MMMIIFLKNEFNIFFYTLMNHYSDFKNVENINLHLWKK